MIYPKSDTLLLVDVFENFRKVCLRIYQLDPAKFLSAITLVPQVALKKNYQNYQKLELLADIDIYQYQKKELDGKYVNLLIHMQKLIMNI